jgi:predicted DCC family thiol-disulfide oxidoreductase YuxK
MGYILPKFIRDKVYDFVAKNRYKWFGKKEECLVPTGDLLKRFL